MTEGGREKRIEERGKSRLDWGSTDKHKEALKDRCRLLEEEYVDWQVSGTRVGAIEGLLNRRLISASLKKGAGSGEGGVRPGANFKLRR